MSSKSNRSQTSNPLGEELLKPAQEEFSARAVQHDDNRKDALQPPADDIRNGQQMESDEPVTSTENNRHALEPELPAELARNSSSSTSESLESGIVAMMKISSKMRRKQAQVDDAVGQYIEQMRQESQRLDLQPYIANATSVRCCIIAKGSLEVRAVTDPQDALWFLSVSSADKVCIIEGVDTSWHTAFGVHFGLPPAFFLRHSDDRDTLHHSSTQNLAHEYFAIIDDLLERLFRLAREPLELDHLSKSLAFTRSIFTRRGVASEHSDLQSTKEDLKIARERVKSVRQDLRMLSKADQVDNKKALELAVSEIMDSLKPFDSRRLGNWYSLIARWEEPYPLPASSSHDASNQDQVESSAGDYAMGSEASNLSRKRDPLRSNLSYARANRNTLIVLVDPPSSTLCHKLTDERECFNLRFAPLDAHSNRGLLLPGLFADRQSGIYKSLQLFASKQWHLDLLCGEEEYLPMNSTETPPASSSKVPAPDELTKYGALDPQAFLYLVSSFVWEQNMQHLETQTRNISFVKLRDFEPSDAPTINNDLYDNRKDLNFLIQHVTETDTRMPTELADYYDAFPRIRRRHKATYLSPVDHHKNILSRAKDLERLLLDSFRMLMSSVSVQQARISNEQAALSNEQATLSNEQAQITAKLAEDTAKQASASAEQARAATRITALAFVYIPLTFVTGIFGMKIRTGTEDPKGFIWYAPLVTLAVAIVFTAALWYLADWAEGRLVRRREERRSQVENGWTSKTAGVVSDDGIDRVE